MRYLLAVTAFLALLVAAVFPRTSTTAPVTTDPEPALAVPAMDRAFVASEASRDLDRPHPSASVLPAPVKPKVQVKAVKVAKPAAKPKRTFTATPKRSSAVNWVAVAKCESGDHWNHHSATAGLYWGGLQMTLGFWRTYGGLTYAARPDLATEAQQIAVADRAYKSRGLSPWPTCGRYG